MKKLREGKTKTIFEADGGNILLLFKDDVTGEGNVIDPGANTVIGKVEGKGNASLRMSKFFFDVLERADVPTHYISANIEENTMLVKKAETFGDGLEFICRIKAAGSFIRRYGKYAEENQPLDCLVEITLKDDQRGDPLINDESIVKLGLMTAEEVDEAKEITRQVGKLVKQELEHLGLELIDMKIEFGRVDGKVVVIDEISGDSMRVFKDGKSLQQKELCELLGL